LLPCLENLTVAAVNASVECLVVEATNVSGDGNMVETTNDSGNCRVAEPKYDMIAIDGAVVVQLLKPGKSKTFLEYSATVFEPYIMKEIGKVERLDLVWDRYLPNSLKATARAKRGLGLRVRVGLLVPMPHKLT